MNFANFVLDKINQVVTDPYSIKEQPSTVFLETNLIKFCDRLSLYLTDGYYDLILNGPNPQDKPVRLFHLPTSKQKEALSLYDELVEKLLILYKSSEQCQDLSTLQTICNLIRSRSVWSPAHIAVEAGLENVYSKEGLLAHWIDSQSCVQHYTPLHIACQLKQISIVTSLINGRADLNKCDDKGNTALHLSVNVGSHEIFKVICSGANQQVLNLENSEGETALHVACKLNREAMCKVLIEQGADPFYGGSIALPIHYALKYGSLRSLEVLLNHAPQLVHTPCNKHGGIPLHWCKKQEDVELLHKFNTPTEISSKASHLPLHIMVLRGRLEAAVAIILGNGDVNGKGKNGNTALHLAVHQDCVMLVKMLLLFGADHTIENDFGETSGILAIRSNKPNKKSIVELLSSIGGVYAKPLPKNTKPQRRITVSSEGCRVLCLDGGGIRGLILTQILMALEKACGKKSKDLFDWIVGTSTGGLLALGLAQGKSALEVQRLYFRFKEKVFIGSRPYNSEPMEEFLKQEFGEETTMESISNGPKVLVTTALADRKPMHLHFFRNYCMSDFDVIEEEKISKRVKDAEADKLKEKVPSLDHPLWKVARSSGAAPTYFRPMDKFLDGGLIANNPTLDALTEIHKYYKHLMKKEDSDKRKEVGIVVSVGTGCLKTTVAKSVDVYRPTNPVALVNSALAGLELSQMLVDVACETDGFVVERAKAWCEMMDTLYFRLNPMMDDDILLDEVDNTKLLNLMWETQIYLHKNKTLIEEVASALSKPC